MSSLLDSPSASPVREGKKSAVQQTRPSSTKTDGQTYTTPQKRRNFHSIVYEYNDSGMITNFNDGDLMRSNKSSNMLKFDEKSGLKHGRILQYFLPYSMNNMNVLEKYGDMSFYYYYRLNDVVVYHLPLLKNKLGDFTLTPNDDFDENWIRKKISNDETSDSLFFTEIFNRCNECSLEIDGIYSPAARNMHEEVILFHPRQLIDSGHMEILSSFMY